jgi:hypothetical protein
MPNRHDKCFADCWRKVSKKIGKAKAKKKGFNSLSYLGLRLYGTTEIHAFFMQLLPPSRLPNTLSKKR